MNLMGKDFEKRLNSQRAFVTWFIRGILALICFFLIGFAIITYQAVNVVGKQDWSGGIKPVIEQLWCGKPGCF